MVVLSCMITETSVWYVVSSILLSTDAEIGLQGFAAEIPENLLQLMYTSNLSSNDIISIGMYYQDPRSYIHTHDALTRGRQCRHHPVMRRQRLDYMTCTIFTYTVQYN
jgi:hypothetical protein